MTALAVVRLSESFSTVWPDLAAELGLAFSLVGPDKPPPADAVAVLVAAGGEEQRALDLLPGLPRANGAAIYVVGSRESHRFAVAALRAGASDYFALPAELDLLRRTLRSQAETYRERQRRESARSADDPFRKLVGSSPALSAVLDAARRVAPHGTATVLLTGETGTGKELLARALHEAGPRAAGPLVPVNCAAIPAQLLESELFGHERGAFTDAHQTKRGLFEEADRGTLFLDEIGHLPLALQGKLLRALDEKRIRRVGGTEARAVDVRIIAATHVDLRDAVERGDFREDLYYRLNVVVLELPPLRARGGDIEQLAEAFVASLAARYGLPVPSLTPEVRAALKKHDWPGNVRELRHALERALLLSDRGTLDPTALLPPARAPRPGAIPDRGPLAEIIAAAVKGAIDRCGGNKSAAARELGISRQRLQRILDGADDERA
ncbi:MAG TPA: sigma-54 dependent transcriptional regulator [Gemmatimonadales bacterium]|nr:sigma-54 dependent transcriptional regulator [Gemmatimonadales bacterium]